MSRTTINELAVIVAGAIGLAAYVGLIVIPACSSYSRIWERVAATVLTLYVLAVLVALGALGALLVIYFWG